MGCWGITAMESDTGLDAMDFIRRNLPMHGKMKLDRLLEKLNRDPRNAPPGAETGESHSSVMVLAEVMMRFMDGEAGSLDYDEDWAKEDSKFSSVTSFTASREAVQWVRDYISDTLQYAKEYASSYTEGIRKQGGWFEEKNWIGWQEHVSKMVRRLDQLLDSSEEAIELIPSQRQEFGEMEKSRKNEEPLQNKLEM